MPVTLNAVAAHAGVSTSTASRALSGHPAVLPDTRRRVAASAVELGYHPNRMASALRTRRSGLVGLVVNNLRNATFHVIAETLQAWGAENGQQVLICTTGGDPVREAAFLHTVRTHRLDGVVVAGSGANGDLVNGLVGAGCAVVTMNREVPGARAPSVMSDYATAARLATEHLIALGHTRIAAIEGPPDVTSGRLHHEGFAGAMADAGLPVDDDLVCRGAFHTTFGVDSTRRMLQLADPPTGLVVTNHEASFGVLPVLGEFGIDVPGRLSVVLTEDEPFWGFWSPPLTVVDNRADVLASRAADLLLTQLGTGDDNEPEATEDLIAPVLRERGSTAPPPG
ncbi:LacI family DNA-binding transcriptional regulator [Modestobacter sp. Leaf380]|uniref:LacI family DNA-binding transcriptional regulator n=1 Tax=Modestobacter sp. Leaf380 TaxID=1736356 RepID=UPI0006F39811|nr:LacI family DNA-binding transcriptional regulator [Modestobacter sp. Leaf380]KQS68221.1 hypothetical protein ASG41_04180 [Modestobacter sp. Leaf380]